MLCPDCETGIGSHDIGGDDGYLYTIDICPQCGFHNIYRKEEN